MTKRKLKIKTSARKEETKRALQTVYDSLNQGQQKKIVKDQTVYDLLVFYGVEL